MAKILTAEELGRIVLAATSSPGIPLSADRTQKMVCDAQIDDLDQYTDFVTDLANVVAKHYGGRVGLVEWVDELDNITVAISQDGNIPEGGGIYKDFDKEGELE
jgi:hypothetical protein